MYFISLLTILVAQVYQAFLTLFLRALFPTFDKTVEERRLLCVLHLLLSYTDSLAHRIAPCDYNLHIVGRRMLYVSLRSSVAAYNDGLATYCRYPYKEYEARGETLPPALFTTRRSLEALLRTLVKAACPHIEYIHGTATDLKLSTDGRRVTAVSVRTDSATVQDLQCGIVVGTQVLFARGTPLILFRLHWKYAGGSEVTRTRDTYGIGRIAKAARIV